MGFKPRFTKNDIAKQMAEKRINFRNAILERLNLVGNEFVKMAREKTGSQGGFNDITGNLRSSIGFVVLDHGNIVEEGFQMTKNGSEGLSEAKRITKELSSEFSEGYALIVVAGMDYAAAVESKGKDVITGSSLQAEVDLKNAIKNLKQKLSRL